MFVTGGRKTEMSGDIAATAPVFSMSYGLIIMVLVTSFAGVVIQSTSGFGYAITLMAILPLLVPDLLVAVAATGVITTIQTAMSAWRYRKGTQWKLLPPILGCFLVTNFLAIRFAAMNPVDMLRRPMGAFLIILAVYFMFFADKIKIKGSPLSGCVTGSISGVAGGLFSIPGPPTVVYLLSATSSNVAYMATLQTFFFSTGIYANIVRYANGLITYPVLMLTAPAIVGLVIGNILGARLFDKLNPARLRRLVYIVMTASGLSMLIMG